MSRRSRNNTQQAAPEVSESYLYAIQFQDNTNTVGTYDRERMVEALKVYTDPNHPEDPPRYGAHLVRRLVTVEIAEWEPLDEFGNPLESSTISAMSTLDSAHNEGQDGDSQESPVELETVS